jgi:hypothetical protein
VNIPQECAYVHFYPIAAAIREECTYTLYQTYKVYIRIAATHIYQAAIHEECDLCFIK